MLNYRNEIQMAANKLDHRRVQPSLNTGPLKSHFKTKCQVSTNTDVHSDLAVSLFCVIKKKKKKVMSFCYIKIPKQFSNLWTKMLIQNTCLIQSHNIMQKTKSMVKT